MAGLNEAGAKAKLEAVLSSAGVSKVGLLPVAKLKGGKLYELFCLSMLLNELAKRGYLFHFSASTIAFKTGGGPIKAGDFHVDVIDKQGSVVGQIFTDVEVRTLGWKLGWVSDLSQYHETDIVVVAPGTTGYPDPDDLLIGIECKATANFQKSHVREVLGRRRELSLYDSFGVPAPLYPGHAVTAYPPSEYWLAFIDPAGNNYRQSPEVFAVELKHWQP